MPQVARKRTEDFLKAGCSRKIVRDIVEKDYNVLLTNQDCKNIAAKLNLQNSNDIKEAVKLLNEKGGKSNRKNHYLKRCASKKQATLREMLLDL